MSVCNGINQKFIIRRQYATYYNLMLSRENRRTKKEMCWIFGFSIANTLGCDIKSVSLEIDEIEKKIGLLMYGIRKLAQTWKNYILSLDINQKIDKKDKRDKSFIALSLLSFPYAFKYFSFFPFGISLILHKFLWSLYF